MLKSLFVALFAGTILAVGAAEEGIAHFQLGDMELIALQDTAASMKNSIFRGAEEEELLRLAPTGESPASVNVFLLKREEKSILVDTGNGGSRGSMADKLQKLDINPEMIDAILLTHMHFDHIGGLVSETGEAFFPKAVVYVSTLERDYWSSLAAGTGGERAMKVLTAYGGRIKTFSNGTEVLAGIAGLEAFGHTPGHTVFETDSLLILGDLLHSAALQFPNPDICATYDMDMLKAIKSRKEFYEKAAVSGKTVAGMHLPFPGIGKIDKDDAGNYRFTPWEVIP